MYDLYEIYFWLSGQRKKNFVNNFHPHFHNFLIPDWKGPCLFIWMNFLSFVLKLDKIGSVVLEIYWLTINRQIQCPSMLTKIYRDFNLLSTDVDNAAMGIKIALQELICRELKFFGLQNLKTRHCLPSWWLLGEGIWVWLSSSWSLGCGVDMWVWLSSNWLVQILSVGAIACSLPCTDRVVFSCTTYLGADMQGARGWTSISHILCASIQNEETWKTLKECNVYLKYNIQQEFNGPNTHRSYLAS